MTSAGIDWQREKWKSGFGSKFIRQGEKNAVKYADEIVVLSKGVQDYFKDTYGRETRFIPNGVNRPEIQSAKLITEKFDLTKDSYILFLGRLVPEKGLRYLIEAFKAVKTNKKLVIAGGSSDTDSFMKELQESAKSDNRIIFTGFVQGQLLDELYSNAYIYTLPSDLEGMPLSLLEAMSYGNCCLVSDIPECVEVVEDKALVFKKSDTEDLRTTLQKACEHPEHVAELKQTAADFICQKYNWDNVVEETVKLYRSESRNTVAKVLKKAAEINLSWPLDFDMTDSALEELMFPKDKSATNKRMPNFDYIRKELLRNGVNKKLLWVEYCEECRMSSEEPLMYSQFCYYIQKDEEKRRATIHKRRKKSSTIFCSQFRESEWYQQICDGESTLADAIMDRISYDSYKIDIESVDPAKDLSMREVYGLDPAMAK